MKSKILSLNKLKEGEKGMVTKLLFHGDDKRRILDLGLVTGTIVESVQKSPAGNPIAYLIRGAVMALRNEDACNVIVKLIR